MTFRFPVEYPVYIDLNSDSFTNGKCRPFAFLLIYILWI